MLEGSKLGLFRHLSMLIHVPSLLVPLLLASLPYLPLGSFQSLQRIVVGNFCHPFPFRVFNLFLGSGFFPRIFCVFFLYLVSLPFLYCQDDVVWKQKPFCKPCLQSLRFLGAFFGGKDLCRPRGGRDFLIQGVLQASQSASSSASNPLGPTSIVLLMMEADILQL